ncbi:MAG TPA: hypothetical protein VF703_13640 [Pyrinomonadaceae bacterium]
MDSFYKGCLMFIAAVLGILGGLSMFIFLFGLLIISPASIQYWHLLIGTFLLAGSGWFLYLAYTSKPY